VIVAVVLEATGLVVTGNVAVVAPARTVTLANTWTAAVFKLISVTTTPPEGAGLTKATVP
jgi:hypothetical protein